MKFFKIVVEEIENLEEGQKKLKEYCTQLKQDGFSQSGESKNNVTGEETNSLRRDLGSVNVEAGIIIEEDLFTKKKEAIMKGLF